MRIYRFFLFVLRVFFKASFKSSALLVLLPKMNYISLIALKFIRLTSAE